MVLPGWDPQYRCGEEEEEGEGEEKGGEHGEEQIAEVRVLKREPEEISHR